MTARLDFDGIKSRVRPHTQLDLDAILARYRKMAPKPNVDGFLLYLRDQKIIDTRLFTELHTADDVVMTQVGGFAEALGARGTLMMSPEAVADTLASDFKETMAAVTERDVGAPDHPEDAKPTGGSDVYEILGELGKGAMGEVHLARDMVLRRKVALKSILPAMQENRGLFSRFLGEMQITAQLDHPFIVPVYGIENGPGGGVAYAMKLVQGREFAHLLEEAHSLIVAGKPLPEAIGLEGRLETFLKVCDAIAFAHERGVVHRNLKPANIMIGRFNEVYVMDWGIARLMGKAHVGPDAGVEMYDAEGTDVRQTNRTRIGSTIGTPIYMSPEQAAGRNDELDGRSNLYSLGLILQEIVTLTGAVGGTTLEEVLTNAKDARRIPPRPPAPGVVVPRELRAIIDKATRLRPDDRYPGVIQFADDIRHYLRNEPITAQPDSTTQAAGRWVSKHRMAALVMVLAALVLGATATIAVLLYNRATTARQHRRELRLAELQASSNVRTQDLDEVFWAQEAALMKFTGAVSVTLENEETAAKEIHFAESFKKAGPGAAPDLADSPYYGGPVSFEWSVASLPAGSSQEIALAQLGGIENLKAVAKAIMLESFDDDFSELSEKERDEALRKTGVPITRIELTMTSGLHVEYPGHPGLAPDYDARKDPAYLQAIEEDDVVWSEPKVGKDGRVIVSCSAPLYDTEEKLLGVLMFDVDAGKAVDASLDTASTGYIETSIVVDTAGNVIAQRNAKGVQAEGESLALPEVTKAIAKGQTGYLETTRRGHPVLVTYQPLNAIGWYVVTVANQDRLEETETPDDDEFAGSVAAEPDATTKAAEKKQKAANRAARPTATFKPAAAPTTEPTVDPSAEPTTEPSASAPPIDSAPPLVAGPTPSGSAKLWGKIPSATATATPTGPPPPNPFDPWKAYDKGPPKP